MERCPDGITKKTDLGVGTTQLNGNGRPKNIQMDHGGLRLGIHRRLGQFRIAASTEGSSPRFLFWAIMDSATHLRLAELNKGFGPRLAPVCLPGNQSGSASIFA